MLEGARFGSLSSDVSLLSCFCRAKQVPTAAPFSLIVISALTLILVHFQIFPFLSNCFLAVELENTQEVQSRTSFLKNQEDFPGLELPTWGAGAVTPACHLPFLAGTGRTCQTGTSRS